MHRMLGITYKTAWFMTHRIREATRVGKGTLMGGEGKIVEVDETFVGGKEKNKHAKKRKHVGTGGAGKEPVFALVERGGPVRTFHVANVTAKNLKPILKAHLHSATFVVTDEGATALALGREFEKTASVNHGAGEYVRGDAHTNTAENYFSIMKRGIYGVYHHV